MCARGRLLCRAEERGTVRGRVGRAVKGGRQCQLPGRTHDVVQNGPEIGLIFFYLIVLFNLIVFDCIIHGIEQCTIMKV